MAPPGRTYGPILGKCSKCRVTVRANNAVKDSDGMLVHGAIRQGYGVICGGAIL